MGSQTVANEEGVAAARAAATPLPCLYINNSDKETAETGNFQKQDAASQSRTRKAAFALATNVEQFVERYGIDNCGFFTVTFPLVVSDPKEAQRRYNNFARRVLVELFGDRIRVLESHADGRPHYHLLVDCRADIRTGFDWEFYEKVRKYNGYARECRKAGVSDRPDLRPVGSLNRSPALVVLHEKLNAACGRYGIGRCELTPIRSSSEAVGRYVGGYIAKGAIWRDERYKGARTVSYSQGFERKVKGAFAWVEHGRKWREAVAAWATLHGCADLDEIKAVFGAKWGYSHSDEILRNAANPVQLPEWAKQPLANPPVPAGRDSRAFASQDDSGNGGTDGAETASGRHGEHCARLESEEENGGGGARSARTGAKRGYALYPSGDFRYKTKISREPFQKRLNFKKR